MQLINWDAIEQMDKLIDQWIKVDTIITDPPYSITQKWSVGSMWWEFWKWELSKNWKVFKQWTVNLSEWLDKAYNILKDWTHIYIMVNDKNLKEYLNQIDNSNFNFIKTLIWCKPNKICWRFYMTQKETIIFARKWTQRNINNFSSSDVITTPNFKKSKTHINNNGNTKKINLHDTEKPVELISQFVKNSTNEWEKVLDMFAWIWTTWVACQNTNRDFVWIELDEWYYNTAKERIEENLF